MPHTKSLHNYHGVNLSASTKLSRQKKPGQINNPEQSRLSDCFLHHSRSAGRLHFRSHTLKEFFLKNIFGTNNTDTVDPEQLVSDEAV